MAEEKGVKLNTLAPTMNQEEEESIGWQGCKRMSSSSGHTQNWTESRMNKLMKKQRLIAVLTTRKRRVADGINKANSWCQFISFLLLLFSVISVSNFLFLTFRVKVSSRLPRHPCFRCYSFSLSLLLLPLSSLKLSENSFQLFLSFLQQQLPRD